MWVVSIMKSGRALRISIPQQIQHTLDLHPGDLLTLETPDNRQLIAWKLSREELHALKLRHYQPRPD